MTFTVGAKLAYVVELDAVELEEPSQGADLVDETRCQFVLQIFVRVVRHENMSIKIPVPWPSRAVPNPAGPGGKGGRRRGRCSLSPAGRSRS